MDNVKIISFPVSHEAFDFLGVKNVISDSSDFGAIWNAFFSAGGYDVIDPFQKDPNRINLWIRTAGETVYFQGKIVEGVADVPDGYSLERFPAGEYLVVTTEWLPTYESTMKHINHDYYENAPLPAGYRRRAEADGIFLIERWGARTDQGYRYEFWLPIERT